MVSGRSQPEEVTAASRGSLVASSSAIKNKKETRYKLVLRVGTSSDFLT